MTLETLWVLGLLAACMAAFIANRPRMDVVALSALVALVLAGTLTLEEALAGFSDPNIILIAALFVIGEGLVRTGVAQRLGDWLVAKAGSSETRLLPLLMAVVAALGSVMSSTGVVAIFIPIVLRIAQATGWAPGRLMMPLSMAALISGMMTLVATAPNLVVNAELVRSGSPGFGFFSFTPFGLPILVLGIGYMLFARRWLAAAGEGARGPGGRPRLREWVEVYGLAGREHRVRVTARSPLVGRTLEEMRLRNTSGANLLAIERPARFSVDVIRPLGKTVVRAGDTLLIDLFAPDADIVALRDELALQALPSSGGYFVDRAQQLGMVEVMLPYGSALVGKTLIGAEFRTRYGLNAVGLRRGRTAFGPAFKEEELKVGDTLLLVGFWKELQKLPMMRADLLVLDFPAELDDVLPAGRFAPQALACLALVIGLMVSGIVPNVQAALIGCLLMGALRCLDIDSAYRSLNWQSLILIVGMLPFAIALQKTGGMDSIVQGLLGLTGDSSPRVVMAALFALTLVVGLFISNTATAVLMAPIALGLAQQMDVSPYPFAMTVALSASASFMTPVSSPVNTLVIGPGQYRFMDFVRLGVPFALLVLIVCVLVLPWLYG